MKNFKYSWQQIAKASFVGVATTATFYLAKTTGLFSSWFSSEETLESKEMAQSLDSGFSGNGERIFNAGQRQLLQSSSGVTLANPIPDQVIQVGIQYQYSLDNVFSGNYSLIWVEQVNGQPLPSWLSVQYKLNTIPNNAGGVATGIAVSGTTAFVADNGVGLQIVDVSNTSNPRVLSTVPNSSGGNAYSIALNGTMAFVADYGGGLQIVDVSNISNPRVLSTVPAGSLATSVAVNGATAFVADYSVGLQIVDVGNISNPRVLSIVANSPSGAAYGVAVSGTTAFVADGSAGLQIVDISNTSNPRILSTLANNAGGSANGVAVSGTTVFVADYSGGLQIVDVSNTSNPRVLSIVANIPGGRAGGVAVSGSMVFVADDVAGLQIVDVNNGSNPRILSTVANNIGGTARNVAVSGATVFVADANAGSQIVDVSQAKNLMGVPPSTQIGQPLMLKVSVKDATGMVLSTSFTLTCDQLPRPAVTTLQDQSIFPGVSLNLPLQSQLLFTNPRNVFLRLVVVLTNGQRTPQWLKVQSPQIVSTLSSAGDIAWNVAVSGTTAFVANTGGGLQIVDVSNPSNPRVLSTVPSAGIAQGVAVSGTTAFVVNAGINGGLQIVDVSNASNPHVLSNLVNSIGGNPKGVAVSGTTAFVADYGIGLQIVDVSNHSSPRVLSIVNNSAGGLAQGVAVSGTTAFVADGSAGLQIVDVSNTSNPRVLSTVSSGAGYAFGVAVIGTKAFVADGSAGLQIVDVSNTSSPRVLSTVPNSAGGSANGVAMSGTTAFVADVSAGLQIVDVSNISAPCVLSTVPSSVGGIAYGVAVSGTTVFVADRNNLQIIDLSQWQLTATPGVADVGNYQVQVTATDDLGGTAATQSFTIRVEGPPRFNSSIPTQYAKIGQAFNYFIPQGLIGDPNFDPISFSARLSNNQSLPSWLSFSGISASFVGIPSSSSVGNLTIVLSATDNIAGSTNTSFTLIITHLPVVSQRLSNAFAQVNQAFQYFISSGTFFQTEGLSLNYSAQLSNQASLPPWLRFNTSALFLSGQPNSTNVGSYDLQIVATDPYAGQAIAGFSLTVSLSGGVQVNRLIGSQMAGVGQRYVFVVPSDSFIDPQGSFTLQTSALPSWLTFTASTGQFLGTPSSSSQGVSLINLTATDSSGSTAAQSFNLTVTYFPQVVTQTPDQIAPIGQPYQLNLSSSIFIDQNGYLLMYRAEQSNGQPLPDWLSFNVSSFRFFGTPNITQAIRYSLAVVATNPLGAEGRDIFSLFAEHYPTVQQVIPDAIAGVGLPLRLTILGNSFNDLDNDPLTYAVTRADQSPLPNWLTFDSQALILSGTPLSAQIGNWSLLVAVSDPSGGTAKQNFTLIVRYVPTVAQPVSSITPVREGRLLNYTLPPGTFVDAGGATLRYNASQESGMPLPSWLNFTALTQNFIGLPTTTDVGALNVRVIADDGQGGAASVSFTFTITPNYPPVLSKPISNSVASVHQPFRLALPPDTFTDANNDPLSYTASQVDGSGLPRWLAYDEKTLTFSGTPGRSDTGAFSEKIIPVRFTARDDQSSASTQFNINVQGTSNIALFVAIAAPIATILTGVLAAYQKRALCFNRYKKERYERLDVEVKVGEIFEHKFGDINMLGKKILVKTPVQLQGWTRFFQSPRQRVPGNRDMPSWMAYDLESNSLRSTIPVPDTSASEFIVQVKDSAGIVHEQFTLRVVGLQSQSVSRAMPDADTTLATFQ